MSQQPTNSSDVCMGIIDIRDHFHEAAQDGFVSQEERGVIESEIEQVYVQAEMQDIAILYACQLLRIPRSAPNKHLMGKIEDVNKLVQKWRGRPKLKLVVSNPDDPEAA